MGFTLPSFTSRHQILYFHEFIEFFQNAMECSLTFSDSRVRVVAARSATSSHNLEFDPNKNLASTQELHSYSVDRPDCS